MKWRTLIKEIYDQREVDSLSELATRFNRARDKKKNTKPRIDILIDTLLLATSYEERLTSIKIKLLRVRAQIAKEEAKQRRAVASTNRFQKSSKKDQDGMIELECFDVLQEMEYVDAKIEQLDIQLEYVRSACFNIKAAMGSLKEFIHE